MSLILKNPIAIFDIEATGLNVSKDRIVEIAIIKIFPDGTEKEYLAQVNPGMIISQEVIDIHGITNEAVKDKPAFAALAKEIMDFIGDADLAGYNSNKFDIPVLAEELLRADVKFDVSNRHFVDVQNMYYSAKQLYNCKVDYSSILKNAILYHIKKYNTMKFLLQIALLFFIFKKLLHQIPKAYKQISICPIQFNRGNPDLWLRFS